MRKPQYKANLGRTGRIGLLTAFALLIIAVAAVSVNAADALHTPPGEWAYCDPLTIRTVGGAPQLDALNPVSSGDEGPALQAQIKGPIGDVAAASDGTIYLSDSGDHVIRKITPDGKIHLVAGQYGQSADYTNAASYGDEGPATQCRLSFPWGMALDGSGSLYVVDSTRVRKITTDGIIHTVAGSAPVLVFTDTLANALADFRSSGPATSAKLHIDFTFPKIQLAADGTLYLLQTCGISRISPAGMIAPLVEGGHWSLNGSVYFGAYQFVEIVLNSKGELFGSGGPSGTVGVGDAAFIFKIDGAGNVSRFLGNGVTDSGNEFKMSGPVTPTTTIRVVPLGFDAQDKLWWAHGVDGAQILHLDADNVIRWSGIYQTHSSYPAAAPIENGPDTLALNQELPGTSLRQFPGGGFVFSAQLNKIHTDPAEYAKYFGIRILERRAPAIFPQFDVSPTAISASAKVGDASVRTPITVRNQGSTAGWYATSTDGQAWLSIVQTDGGPPQSSPFLTSFDQLPPGGESTATVVIDPTKIAAAGVYAAQFAIHTLGTIQPPQIVNVTFTASPSVGPLNLPPAILNHYQIIRALENTPLPFTLQATDDGNPNPPGKLTYSIVGQPAHGTATVSGNELTYTPAANYITGQALPDQVVWKVSDGQLEDTGTIGVFTDPTTHLPYIFQGPAAAPNPAAVGQSIAFSAAAGDLDNNPLTYSWDFGDGAAGTGNTPTHVYAAGGKFNVVVTVSDGKGGSASKSVTVIVNATNAAAPVISSATTANGFAGASFTYTIAASNSPTQFNASGLPAGLSINTGSGVISGTPTAAGQFNVVLSASNSSGTGRQTLVLSIGAGLPVITSPLSASTTVGAYFVYTIQATNNPASFASDTLSLPMGAFGNGQGAWVPQATGTYTINISASNAAGTGAANLVVTVGPQVFGPPLIQSSTTATGKVGDAFSYQIVAINAPAGSSSATATNLPPGLSFDSNAWIISGAPTMQGAYNVSLTVTGPAGTTGAVLVLTILPIQPANPTITSAATVSGNVGLDFWYAITASNQPTGFAATNLPPGLQLNTNTGAIFGVPTATGTFTVNLTATGASGVASGSVVITINSFTPTAPVITSAPTASGTRGQDFVYAITATNNPASFNATGLPSGLTVHSGSGIIDGRANVTGVFTVSISAANSAGTGAATLILTINSPRTNQPPAIDSAPSANPNPVAVGQNVSFSIAASDPDGDALTYAWKFGDGAVGAGSSPAHAYVIAGTYDVTVTASDAGGLSATEQVRVTVNSPKAVFTLSVQTSGSGSGTVSLSPAGGAYPAGTVVSLTAAPNSGSAFAGWSGAAAGSANPTTVTMNSNTTVTATFNTLGGGNDDGGGGDGGGKASAMSIAKLQGNAKFNGGGHDTCTISGIIPGIPAGFSPSGQVLTVDIGGARVSFTLDAKGHGKSSQGSVALNLKITRKKPFTGGLVAFTARIQNGAWSGVWGFDLSKTVKNQQMPMAISIQLAGVKYTDLLTVTYTAKANVGGKFKK